MRVGVDIGGTFTDLVAYDEKTGRFHISKASTIASDLSIGIKECLRKSGVDVTEAASFVHGSTVVINTIIERKGARTALLTTKGFADIAEIGRGYRVESYNLFFKKHVPLVDRDLRLEVSERTSGQGDVLTPLEADEVGSIATELRNKGVESFAISFINSYVNPQNEILAAEILSKEFPEKFVTYSSNLLRKLGEYERTSTTILNAYAGPIVTKYLEQLDQILKSLGFRGSLFLLQSNGGAMSKQIARTIPISMVESGPVSGALGAAYLAKLLGYRNMISFDMGGTTAKTCTIHEYEPVISSGYHIGGYASGHPMMLPVLDIIEIGAGGGSIAHIDEAGRLKVGPESAGGEPGPVCYLKGGKEPTVTDANLVVGRINPQFFLGGEFNLGIDEARESIGQKIATPLKLDVEDAADGVIRIVNSNMSLAIRSISIERGYDPRDFVMLAYGGAGPMHSASLAGDNSIPKVVVPPLPGHFCALGMMFTNFRHDFVQTVGRGLSEIPLNELNQILKNMASSSSGILLSEGIEPGNVEFTTFAEIRYVGQRYTLRVPITQEVADKDILKQKFDKLYLQTYGHSSPDQPVQVVEIVLSASGILEKPELPKLEKGGKTPASNALRGKRKVLFDIENGFISAPTYLRDRLLANNVIQGPAIVEEYASTTVINQNDVLTVGEYGELIIEVE